MALNTLNLPFAALAAGRRTRAADDKSPRDYAVFFNSLLLIMDFAGMLMATYAAIEIYSLWFATVGFNGRRWDVHSIAAMIAALAAMLLYDRRFISVASRGQTGALVRCYLTGFALFSCSAFVLGWATGAFRTLPIEAVAMWLAISLLLTGALRVGLTTAVQVCVRKGLLVEVVAIVGCGPRADRFAHYLKQTKPFTPELLGVFDDDAFDGAATGPLGVVNGHGEISVSATGSIDDLLELGKIRCIDWIFVTLPQTDEAKLLSIVNRLKALAVPIAVCPQNLEPDTPHTTVDYICNGMPVTLLQQPTPAWRSNLKTIGQFLPRWITTLMLLAVLCAGAGWTRLCALFADLRGRSAKLLCKIDDYSLEQFVRLALNFGQQRFGYVVTPNVDHFIRLHDDVAFQKLYAAAEYVLMDSRFLSKLLRIQSGIQLPVCTGSDLTAKIFEHSAPTDRLVVVGGSEQQADALARRYGLKNLVHYNPPMGFIRDAAAVEACLQFVEAHSPFRFCLLAVGCPQQEILAERLQARGVARGLTLCIGASINFLTGTEQRAPEWMQRCGMEWLFRLSQDPSRLAARYLIRGPRIFSLLHKTNFVLRPKIEQQCSEDPRPSPATAVKNVVAARAA